MLSDRGFPTDVEAARESFLIAADRAGLRVDSLEGEAGRPYATLDWVRLGAPAAPRLLIIGTGAVGRGSFAAAGALTHLLDGPIRRLLPAGVQALLVHAANPVGPLWPVHDLAPAPPFPLRASRLAQEEESWTSALLANAERRFRDYQRASRLAAEEAEREQGGVYRPAFSDAALDFILAGLETLPRRVAILDIRPGLGRFGELEVRAAAPAASDAALRAHDVFGAELPGQGDLPRALGGVAERLTGVETAPAVAEIGTRSAEGPLLGAIGGMMGGLHGGDPIAANPAWKESFLGHATALTRRAINRLAQAV